MSTKGRWDDGVLADISGTTRWHNTEGLVGYLQSLYLRAVAIPTITLMSRHNTALLYLLNPVHLCHQ